jgi:hypothetical protein
MDSAELPEGNRKFVVTPGRDGYIVNSQEPGCSCLRYGGWYHCVWLKSSLVQQL